MANETGNAHNKLIGIIQEMDFKDDEQRSAFMEALEATMTEIEKSADAGIMDSESMRRSNRDALFRGSLLAALTGLAMANAKTEKDPQVYEGIAAEAYLYATAMISYEEKIIRLKRAQEERTLEKLGSVRV